MSNLTNISKHNSAITNISRPIEGGQPFYGWLFLFTLSTRSTVVTSVSKHEGALAAIIKD